MIMKVPNKRDHAGHVAQFGFDEFAQRAAIAPRRDEQHHEILHRTGKHHAGEDPQHSGQVAHLRGQHRTDQRTRAGDRGEVMAEQNVLVGRHVVETVVASDSRRHAAGVKLHHARGDEQAVVAVGNQVDRNCGNHDP